MTRLTEYLNEAVSRGKKKSEYKVTLKTTTGELAELLTDMGFQEYTQEPLMDIVKASCSSNTPMWFQYTTQNMHHPSDICVEFCIVCGAVRQMYKCKFSRDSKNKPLKLSEIFMYETRGGIEKLLSMSTSETLPKYIQWMNLDIENATR